MLLMLEFAFDCSSNWTTSVSPLREAKCKAVLSF